MNRKGFTLIEVIAVIVLLGIVIAISAPSIISVYDDSKLKSEEIFVDRLSEGIDNYVKFSVGDLSGFTSSGVKNKCQYDSGTDACDSTYSVEVWETTSSISNVIAGGFISAEKYKNAGNNSATCNEEAPVEIYKDSDGVFCFKVKKDNDSLGCLSEAFQETIAGPYAIDTCVWRD